MKKAFTLIELLAVIILLAVISLIATPSIINVVNTAKDKADLESVNGMVDSARLYYSESMMDNDKKSNIDNLNDIYSDVSLLNKPDNGHLYINEKGLIALSVVIRNKCYTKQFSGKIVISNDIDNCTLGYIGIDTEAPTVNFNVAEGTFNTNGWAKNNFNVNITISDSQSGASSYKYCIDTTDCEPIVEVNNITGFSEISNESETNKVCVIGIDNYGNESNIICSDSYKLDKTNPTIAVNNISINKNDTIDLSSNVTTSDTLSGVDNYTYTPTSIDTTIAGNKIVTYIVTDKAGNSTSIDRTITVITDKPTIAYSTLTSPNGNGWFNSGFYVKAIATSDSSTSINNILWCSTTSSTCTPSTSVSADNITAYMTNNSTTNKVCVQAIDATGNSSDTICSSNYQLDSVIPTLTDKGDSITITQGDSYQVSSYFNTPTYGISGGTLSCNPTNTSSLSSGSQTVSCTATSLSGLFSTTNKTITVTQISFAKTVGGSGLDTIVSTIQTSDGGYMLFGNSKSSDGDISGHYGSTAYTDVIVIKIDKNGNKIWSKNYGGTSSDVATSAIQTSDGNYVIAGYTSSSSYDILENKGSSDAMIIKINESGTVLWTKTYGGSNTEDIYSIIQTDDSGYLLVGDTRSTDGDITTGNGGVTDTLIIKADATGTKQWVETYGGNSSDSLNSAIQTSDGGYILVGTTCSYNNDSSNDFAGLGKTESSNDGLILKINSSGEKEWAKVYDGGEDYDTFNMIIEANDGGYLLIGNHNPYNQGYFYGLSVKIDNNGNILWNKNYSYSSYSSMYFYSVVKIDNGYLIAGNTKYSSCKTDGLLLKIDNSGTKLDQKIYTINDLQKFNSIIKTSDNNYFLSGWISSTGYDDVCTVENGNYKDGFVIKLNSSLEY